MVAAARGTARGAFGRIRPRQARREIGLHAGHVRASGERLGERGVRLDLDHVEEEVAAERGAGGAQALEQRRLRRGGVRAQRLVHEAAALGPIADRGGARKVGLLAQDDEHRRALARRLAGEDARVDARRGGLGRADQGEEQEEHGHAGITAQGRGRYHFAGRESGGTGRRAGLRIPWGNTLEGSNPSSRTKSRRPPKRSGAPCDERPASACPSRI